jgi:hypothetical protein
LTVGLIIGLDAVAGATVVTTTDFQTNGTNLLPPPYTPSSVDLINGLSTSAEAGNYNQESAGGTGGLTDGSYPLMDRDNWEKSGFATGGNNGGTTLTYLLPSASNVTSIDVYGGWQDGGRDQQGYNVLYSTSAAPATFIALATVDFNPPAVNVPQATLVSISDDAGNLASDVVAIRFDFNNVENGYTGYAEIDVMGSPIPEPSTLVLAALGVLGLLGYGRRRQRSA